VRLEHASAENLKMVITQIIARHLDLGDYEVFFFGSRVSGTASERSDIDIGIEGPQKIPFSVLSQIREEIDELPVLYKIDVIDFKQASEGFRQVALKHIEWITPCS
jgi:hypothetical protein